MIWSTELTSVGLVDRIATTDLPSELASVGSGGRLVTRSGITVVQSNGENAGFRIGGVAVVHHE